MLNKSQTCQRIPITVLVAASVQKGVESCKMKIWMYKHQRTQSLSLFISTKDKNVKNDFID